MKRFFGFVKKEFYHIFRDLRSMLILFGMPVAQILIFGYVITNEIKNVKIAIIDYSKDHITNHLTNKLLSSGFFVLNEELTDISQTDQLFRKGKIKEVIVFEAGFAEKLQKENSADIQLITDASDANTANLIVNYTQGIISTYLAELNKTADIPVQINTESRMLFNEDLKGSYMFVPGTIALILMLISAMMTSISIAREKETGTMEALLVSPLKPAQIVLGKVFPYVVISFINAISILLLGYFVFDVPIQGSIPLLLAENMLYILLALSIGIFISTMTSKQQVAMFISAFALMMPTLLLSGFIFPIENMPQFLQWITYIMPPRWFIVIIKNIMIKGVGITYVWKETLILLVMTLIFITLSIKKFKIRLA